MNRVPPPRSDCAVAVCGIVGCAVTSFLFFAYLRVTLNTHTFSMSTPIVRRVQVRDILTKSNLPVGDYSVNPYVGCTHACRYCYASFMKRFTGHGEPWGEFLDVKEWPSVRGRKALAGKSLFVGSVTDPYLPEEATYRRTRALLEELRGADIALSIQTKSDLVLRDIDLLRTFRNVRVGFSVNTLDESFRADMDCAVSIERRLAAMKQLHDEGIRTTCFISPIFPGITDVKAIVDRVKGFCNLIWLENLNLRGGFKADILGYIASRHAGLVPLYNDIYCRNNRDYWVRLDADLRSYAAQAGLDYLRDDDSVTKPFDAPPTMVNYFYHEEVRKSAKR